MSSWPARHPYLTEYCVPPEAVIAINAEQVAITAEPHQVLNQNGLESALFSPVYSFGGIYKYATVLGQGAALLNGLAQNHPFEQGNKRTAWLTTVTFLERRGAGLRKVDDAEAANFVSEVVTHVHDHAAMVSWLADRLA